ncbi:MAG: SgcJ/EcaC family oxidoreductase [Methylotenera sp.]
MNTLLRAILIGLVASTLIVACSQKTEEAKVNPANTIEAANAKWNKALNSGNVKELAALYTENATLSPGNGKTIVGRAEIENLFKGFVDGGVHNHTLEIIEVGGTGKMIYQVAKWKAQGAEANGKTPSFGGITTSVLEQGSDGNWLTRTHIWNVNQ